MKPNHSMIPTVALAAGLMLAGCSDNSPVAPDGAGGPSFDRNAPTYSFTTIEVPGARSTNPQGINGDGHIVGGFTDAMGRQHGFLLRDGGFTQIDVPGAGRTAARGIGPDGDIVGNYAMPGDGPVVSYGYRRSESGELTLLEFPGYLHTIPQRILPDGTVIGCAHNNDTMDSMVGVEIGKRGNNPISAFASMTNGATPDLGRMVGLYTNMDTGVGEGFLIEDGVFTALMVPGSFATNAWDMNPRGDIVGVFQDAAGVHGFVLTADGYTTINVPGATATRVFGINARGDLVGTYVLGGKTFGFLAQRV
jgi:probable HAF family extracellular repeat protein